MCTNSRYKILLHS